ncbi:MAG: hypothetical protein CFE41_15755 [Burkholderiales bacterium PBB2]|nr:MAG: hypothetical protein CFE41_15755 [Burkholderiales bacterium PBB2]
MSAKTARQTQAQTRRQDRHLLAALLSAMLAGAPACAASGLPPPRVDRIVWLQGSAARLNPIVAYLKEQLPAIQHEPLDTNAVRSWQMVQRGEPACRPSTVHTRAREAEAYFADTLLAPPPELVLRRDKLHLLPRDAEGAADLRALLEQQRLRGAYARGRSFGDTVDALLAAQRKRSNPMLADYATAAWGDRMRAMLAKDRTDYLIDAPGALLQLQRLGLAAEEYISLPIHGATEPLVLGIACPRNPWGREAILAIDQVLGTPAGAARLREIGKDWFSAESRERYAPQIEQFFQRRSKPLNPE